jgi:hypothetical protein
VDEEPEAVGGELLHPEHGCGSPEACLEEDNNEKLVEGDVGVVNGGRRGKGRP